VDGLNLYAYCGGDPVNGVDPLGLWGLGQGAAIDAIGVGDSVFGSDRMSSEQAGEVVLASAHLTLSLIGMIPGLGAAADLADAELYSLEGNYYEAAVSRVAAIPVAGDAVAIVATGAALAGVISDDDIASFNQTMSEADPLAPAKRHMRQAIAQAWDYVWKHTASFEMQPMSIGSAGKRLAKALKGGGSAAKAAKGGKGLRNGARAEKGLEGGGECARTGERSAGTIDPAAVRFSQSSIRPSFSSGGTIEDLAEGLRNGSVDPAKLPPIRLVDRKGVLYTLDNRRLWAFRQARIPIPYRMATPEEVVAEAWKFTTKNGGTSIRVRGK
jgi:hypothetical protein